jgi:REP element-mobilizing transposase RayT
MIIIVNMTRKLRKQRKDAIYHVMAKGNQGSYIFQEKPNKRYFLKCLEHGSRKFDVEVFAFCIMGNHYHLLLRTREANLSSLMHYIGTSYASRLRDQGNIGHIFSGRYKSVQVDSGQHALFLSRYVHLNPKKAGIVEHPEEYPWSSCMSYLLERGQFDWVNKSFIMGMLSTSPAASRKIYVDYLADPESTFHRFPRFPDNLPLAKAISEGDRFAGASLPGEAPAGSRPIDILHRHICEAYGKDFLFEGRVNSISANVPLLLFVFASREYLLATNEELGQMLQGISCSSVSLYFKRAGELLKEGNPEAAALRRELDSIVEVLWR